MFFLFVLTKKMHQLIKFFICFADLYNAKEKKNKKMDLIQSDLPVSSIHCALINAYRHNFVILTICTTVNHVEYYSFMYLK